MSINIDTYFALNSPWAYLGNARLEEIAARRGCSVTMKPAKFADVFSQTGGVPLAKRSPARKAYRMMELKRWRDHLNIPILLEPKYPLTDHLPAIRLIFASNNAGQNSVRFYTELGRAMWERDEDIADAGVLAAAVERAELNVAALDANACPLEEANARLESNTADALAAGVFGAPSYVLPDGEIFWGQDRVEFLDRALEKLTGTAA